MNVKVNATEVATKLAHEELKNQANINGEDIYEWEGENESKYTDKAQGEFNTLYDYYCDMIMKSILYPFDEGDNYYIVLKHKDKLYGLHKYEIIESCWDEQSEEFYRLDSRRKLFKTRDLALAHIESLKYIDQLSNYKDE